MLLIKGMSFTYQCNNPFWPAAG